MTARAHRLSLATPTGTLPLVVMLVGGVGAGRVIAGSIGPWMVLELPTASASASPQVASGRPEAPSGAELVARNMFCSSCPGATSPGPRGASEAVPPPLVVLAIHRATDGSAVAALSDPASGRQGAFGIGDAVAGGWVLVGIAPREIEVERAGQRARVALDRPEVDGAQVAAARSASNDVPAADGITRLADGTIEIDRRLLDEIRRDPMRRAGARALPASQGGRTIGLRLSGVRPSSPLATLGLKSGDVIVALGDQPLDSVDAMLVAVGLIERADALTIRYLRAGKPVELAVRLR